MFSISNPSSKFARSSVALVWTATVLMLVHGLFFRNGFDLKLVTDVVFDRYEKYGEPYYRYRLEKDLSKLSSDPDNFLNFDDVAVAYDRLGNFDEAMKVLEAKKTAMEKASFDRMAWYRYYANRWTFLIHEGAKVRATGSGAENGEAMVREGKSNIEKALELNVEAHFGRENYQVVANSWMLASYSDSGVLIRENFLRKKALDPELLVRKNDWKSCGERYADIYPEPQKKGKTPEEQTLDACPMALKGVVGMVLFGGGPNPFSYETIGDILVAMGEYRPAYAAYSRAVVMKHPNSKAVAVYAEKVAALAEPDMDPVSANASLADWCAKEFESGSAWSKKYLEKQEAVISAGWDPTDPESFRYFYLLNGTAQATWYRP